MIKNYKSNDLADNLGKGYGIEVREIGNLNFSENKWDRLMGAIRYVAGSKYNLCLLLLLISFIVLFIGVFEKTVILKIVSGIIYYLTIVVILNILVIIKRIKVLFDNK